MAERCIKRTRGLITLKLCEDSKDTFTVEATDARAGLVARANVEAFELGGKRALRITSVNTERGVRRAGVGTAIYELVLDKACELDAQLVSDNHRSEWAEAFWRKQRKKGRATCIEKGRGGYYSGPRASLEQDIRDSCTRKHRNGKRVEACVRRELRKAMKGLPKPKTVGSEAEWPCKRFGIKRAHCKGDRKLDGVVEKRTRAPKQKQVKA